MQELVRLLEVLRVDLEAEDCRAEIGGRAPDDPRVVAVPFGPFRVVARFADAVLEPERVQEVLAARLETFASLAERTPEVTVDVGALRRRELDIELVRLAERSGAAAAMVVDERSPVVWGSSEVREPGWDIPAMESALAFSLELGKHKEDAISWIVNGPPSADSVQASSVDPTVIARWSHWAVRLGDLTPGWDEARWRRALRNARGVAIARASCTEGRAPERFVRHGEVSVLARGFAQVYLLVLIYEGTLNELQAEGAAVRALPAIERLVLSLPPVEPPPRGAKVIALRR